MRAQGCCQSTTAESAASPDDPARPSAFRQADARDHHGWSDNAHVATTAHAPEPQPGGLPNQRIRAPSPVMRSPRNVSQMQPPWTTGHLRRQREIFFETRVAGRPEVWDAIRAAADLLLRGQIEDAQGILDAACITCPSGRVAKGRGRDRVRGGLFDERGRIYEVPDWVVRDPEDLREDEISLVEKDAGEDDEEDENQDYEEEDKEFASGSVQSRRGAKGKGRATGEEQRVRVRFSTGDPDVEVTLFSTQTVAALQRLLRERIERDKRVRLVYLGKMLEPGKTLAAQGWKVGDILSALVVDDLVRSESDEFKGKRRK